ncbi:MAG TPA: protein kinase [Blastocatellia bacterium]|nr:protein kinase [Blastocatellia bacterium]
MGLKDLIGEVLDDKYLIERELGKGGMGSVYSATHLGTDRPVAVKVIAPQFMRNDEFVERFKREAKAAGRLHHPNVVNVTDFGFARVGPDRVAYLVMEFLDGCTLAEVLEEESQLAITWVVDIIEQACSAVDAAHRHGIIHRDLKPDNIWLEPNRRGGYRVKVLDFGLAKLGDPIATESEASQSGGPRSAYPSLSPRPDRSQHSTHASSEPRRTQLIEPSTHTHAGGAEAAAQRQSAPSAAEAQTLIQRATEDTSATEASESATRILPAADGKGATQVQEPTLDEAATQMLPRDTMDEKRAAETAPADGLTRVGSILGTPLYMSPEQCRSERLDARTDIYSLGVIAYQMLAGTPPVTGDMNEVMRQHMETAPPPLKEKRKNIPKRLAKIVMLALAKDPAARPATAAGFASALRAQSEGASALLRRAFALYAEHFPKFFRVSLLVMLPIITLSLLDVVNLILMRRGVITEGASKAISVVIGILTALGSFIATSIIVGVTIRLVNQLFLAPLRPIELKLAFAALRKRIRALMFTTLMVAIGSILLLFLFVVPGVLFYINSSLSGPVVMMENLKGRAALRRSKVLVSRARRTVIGIIAMQYLIPLFCSSVAVTLIVSGVALRGDAGLKMFAPKLTGVITPVLNVLLVPLISTFTALLYLKTRAAGGESLNEAFIQLQEEEQPSRKWEIRIRERMNSSASGSR